MKSFIGLKYGITAIVLLLIIGVTVLTAQSRFTMPAYDKINLKNGLTVYLLEQHEVPLIYATTVFEVGSVNDGSAYGLADLTADALLFGTTHYSKQDIENTFDFLGASLNSNASREATVLKMSFAKKDLPKVLPIWKEIIREPVFNADEFAKRKTRKLVQLEQAKESPREVIGSYYSSFIFGDHMYGNPGGGTRPTVAEITVDDVRNFYANTYGAAQTAIIVAGDFKAAEMKDLIRKNFGDWQKKANQTATLDYDVQKSVSQSRVLLVNKEDARQTTFLIGSTGITRSNPDYVAIQVINTILGGRFTSWLNDALRVNAGLTYGAGSGFAPYKKSGLFYISSFTPTPTTSEAIDLALDVLDSLHTSGIDQETLQSAKNYINGQFPPDYETAGSLADLLADMYIFGFNEDYINTFQQTVAGMSLEEARRIIDTYFPKENLQFVLIGKASDIREQVGKYGAVTEKEITAEGF